MGFPGSIDHLELDVKTIAEWEFDFLKLDGYVVQVQLIRWTLYLFYFYAFVLLKLVPSSRKAPMTTSVCSKNDIKIYLNNFLLQCYIEL